MTPNTIIPLIFALCILLFGVLAKYFAFSLIYLIIILMITFIAENFAVASSVSDTDLQKEEVQFLIFCDVIWIAVCMSLIAYGDVFAFVGGLVAASSMFSLSSNISGLLKNENT